MLLFLITSFTFITIFYKSLCFQFKAVPATWAAEFRLLSLCFWDGFHFSLPALTPPGTPPPPLPRIKPPEEEQGTALSVLDLPDLVLECILEKLPPEGLRVLGSVCRSLRERCTSDRLWGRHLEQKWGRVIGPAAHRAWQCHISSSSSSSSRFFNQGHHKGFLGYLSRFLPISGILGYRWRRRSHLQPVECSSVMSWYLALESGKFWFPAQVYNRENGHVGFMMSCYDAEISYDPKTDTFQARYPPHGRMAVAVESGVAWERIRAPPIDTSPHHLHISDCLNDLSPGDHIEIQWRRNKKFPYGWWYGIVGHLETCDGIPSFCRCNESDSVALDFNQYSAGSRWRRTTVSRKEHREEGNEADGFYGGINKLCTADDISAWKKLWPSQVLE
ncbi:hypothetical protein DM860_006057 [Cuscuta australis]|uniref:F-box domain-containing protein n=2 Tax=Cuscuta sect. Cleistogrammica TaxID=1824901 RepID=A0A328DPI8_9ASTE|nr:hypothetical protein DM860_006057 [Cuscuta australis]